MDYSWNWSVLFSDTGIGTETYLSWIITGLGWLFAISITAWVIAMVIGTTLGIMRTLPNKWARGIATTYVTIFRNVPLLVQLFLWYYVLPTLMPISMQDWWYQSLSPATSAYISAAIGLGLFTAARLCEQVRTGIESLPKGQANAAYAMGFSLPQVYKIVLLPQAFRMILPPLSSELTNCFKNASIASLVGAAELITQIKTASEYTQNTFEFLTYATILYLIINLLLIFGMNTLEKKLRIPGMLTGGKS
ncbi:amino acid ABC transporter permease [Neisseriaceae bacterium CLB008]